MDEKTVEDGILMLTEHVTRIDTDIADIKLSLHVLKALLLAQMFPDSPEDAERFFEQAREAVRDLIDRDAPQRQKVLETIDLVKAIRKTGMPPSNA